MSEEAPHKSHAAVWIISVVVAVVLYLGSAAPVWLSFYRDKGPWLPSSWEKPVETIYKPTAWLLTHTPLCKLENQWFFRKV